jgi:hypothetical protein
LRQNDAVFFCAQNIAEFWNVATRRDRDEWARILARGSATGSQ